MHSPTPPAPPLPRATIHTFWHVPSPHPGPVGICPWPGEILPDMAGSTILAFHTSSHCKNFIETEDCYMEARIEHEHSAISFNGSETFVRSDPISSAWRLRERIAPRVQRYQEAGL